MNDSLPFFSIIIPTYNRAGFILNTLKSVFDQTFTDYEIIIVDNASTDNTRELLQPLINEEKIRYIQHDKNYERAKSRNTGQLAARGTFVTFLDSDDIMYPDNLKDAHSFASENPDCRFFQNLYELIDSDGNVVYRFHFQSLRNPIKQICEGNFLSCIGVFLHQSIYKKLAWDEEPFLTGSEDYDFWIRVIAHEKKVGRINKINSGILHHAGRTMNNLQLETTEQRYNYIISKVSNDSYLSQVYRPYLKRLKAFRWLFLAGIARNFSSGKMMGYLWKGVQTEPRTIFSRMFSYNIYFLLKKLLRIGKN